MGYWSGYARLEREGDAWRLTQPVGAAGSVLIELDPESSMSDAMVHHLASSLLAGLQQVPAPFLAAIQRRAGEVPTPLQTSEGFWTWSDTFAGVNFSVRVALPPGFDEAESTVRRMALRLRASAVMPQPH